jgi:hypothetical protein
MAGKWLKNSWTMANKATVENSGNMWIPKREDGWLGHGWNIGMGKNKHDF